VDSKGQPGSTPLEVTTGTVLGNLTGPLDYAFRTYTILLDPTPAPTVSGGISAIPVRAPAPGEFTVSSFNLERFYDTVNDPSTSDAVLTAAAFDRRLNKASLAIREVLRSPDILGVEEMENLPTLQALADKVNNDAVAAGGPNPAYQAYLVEGNDIGGIDVGFLVKSARVTVIDVTQVGKDTTYTQPDGTPALLNDRPSLVLRATVARPTGPSFPITVIVNHLRSLSGVDDPADGPRVREKRRAQAEFLANYVQARQTADPSERIVLVGDFNAFQVNDGYVDVMGTIRGAPAPASEVVAASNDLVTPDLSDLVEGTTDAERYSYSFDGNAQVLDHILITQNLHELETNFAFARNDADFPESYRNDPDRPERISDHDIPVAYFAFPQADLSITKSGSPATVVTGANVTYTVTVTNNGPHSAPGVTVTDVLPAGLSFVSCDSTGSGVCGGAGNSRTVTFTSLAANQSATITLTATLDCNATDGTVLMDTASVSGGPFDPDSTNDSASASTAVSNPAPVISGASAGPAVLSPPNHKLVPVRVDYSAVDNCGSPVVCGLAVTSNEPVNGTDDGDTAPDWVVVDPHHVRLRAERSGSGSGRVYTVAITCSDASGSASTSNVFVSVPLH